MTTPPSFSRAIAILDEVPPARVVPDGSLDVLAYRADPLAWARGMFGELQPWMDDHLAPFALALAVFDGDGEQLLTHVDMLREAAARLRAEAEAVHHGATGVSEAWSGPAADAARELLIGQREADDAAARALTAWADSVLESGAILAAAKTRAVRLTAALVLRLARDAFRARSAPAPGRGIAVAVFLAEGTREVATCLRETIGVLERATADVASVVEAQHRLAGILLAASEALTTPA